MNLRNIAAGLALGALALVAPATFAANEKKADKTIDAAVSGSWRTPEAKARDAQRHPAAALAFWGLKPGMTILEIQPGGGWWTQILAPYARLTGGRFYATAADLENPQLSDAARKGRVDFAARFVDHPERYGKVELINWGAVSKTLPANTFDFILTARSIHNWARTPGQVEEYFAEFHRALKAGGILAVEQHRAKPGTSPEKPESGYVTEKFVIDRAEKAGFKLAGRSELNANPKDTKDHPFGVWTLPPSLRSTPEGSSAPDDPKFDHSKYLSIGESDRMTLKFIK
jgi:predicted methyltransferase